MNKISPLELIRKKENGDPIVMLTAYDFILGGLIDDCEVDVILIGDSVGNVFCGYQTTVPVTIDQMIYHTKAVVASSSHSLIVTDMPFMSYHVSFEKAIENAGRLMKEGGAHCVKVEVNSMAHVETVRHLVDSGIPVMGHVGFTPQMVHQLGGFKVQGRCEQSEARILKLAETLQDAGAFSVVLELVPGKLAKKLTGKLDIPTIGIGAGVHCDGQVLVIYDLLGLTPNANHKFVKKYADLRAGVTGAVKGFIADVKSGEFPGKENSYS